MPCYDDRNETPYVLEEAKKDWNHNSSIAELLCGVMKRMDNRELAIYAPKGSKLWHWWEDHKERDRKKAEEELLARKQRLLARRNRIVKLEEELRKLKKG
jgi:hypothetical protein